MEINNNLFETLGLTVIDSLWQGAIVMAIAFVGLWVMKKSKANLRHNFLLICIVALPVMGVYTFSQRYEPTATYVETTLLQDIGFISDSEEGLISAPVSTSLDIKNEAFEWVQMTPWIGVFWTVGMFLIFLRAAGGYLYLNRLKSSALHLDDIELNRLFDRLKDDFDLKREVLLKESMKISSPMVYGYFKPVILFPLGLIQGLTTDEVEVILLHELAHLKRNDFLINIVINGLRAVYFYHPVFWWLQSQLDNEREFASDEMVMEHQADGLTLVRALTKAKEFSMLSPSLGFAGSSKNQLLKRVNRIMKKQQKPNWTGLILPCVILLSVVLLSSQTKKPDLMDSTSKEAANDRADSLSYYASVPVFTLDSLDRLKPVGSEKVSIPLFKKGYQHNQNDSISIAQATMELLEDPSPVLVTTDSDGKPTRISRNGKRLRGKTLEVYMEAYMRLNKYSSKVADKKISDFMGRNSQTIRQKEVLDEGLGKLFELESQLLEERQLLGELMLNKQNKEDDVALTKQADKIKQLQKAIKDMILTMTSEQKEVLYQRNKVIERQKQLQDQVDMVELNKELAQATRKLRNKLLVEQQKLDQMILKLTSDPENTDPKAVNDQVFKVDQLKKELSAYPRNSEKYIDYQKSLEEARDREQEKTDAVLQKQQEILALRDELNAREQEIFQGTSYSEDGKTIEFHLGSEGFEFAKNVYESGQESGTNPIIEADGKLRPDLKFSDFKQEDIVSIQIFKGKAQQKRYPNGETKDYNGIISIVTKVALESQKKETEQDIKRAFSPKRSKYNFSESKEGQDAALDVIQGSMKVFESPVLVLDGKFMPKDYLLEYDTYIKSINIYKGNSIKKFPKRKVKGFATVVEVITK